MQTTAGISMDIALSKWLVYIKMLIQNWWHWVEWVSMYNIGLHHGCDELRDLYHGIMVDLWTPCQHEYQWYHIQLHKRWSIMSPIQWTNAMDQGNFLPLGTNRIVGYHCDCHYYDRRYYWCYNAMCRPWTDARIALILSKLPIKEIPIKMAWEAICKALMGQ